MIYSHSVYLEGKKHLKISPFLAITLIIANRYFCRMNFAGLQSCRPSLIRTMKPYLPHMIILCCYSGIALSCQLSTGDFPAYLFVFPVNVTAMAVWIALISAMCLLKPLSGFTNRATCAKASVAVIGLFAAVCIIQGFSTARLTGSWWFVAATFLLLSQLLAVCIRGLSRSRPRKLRFALIHIGLLLALGGGFWGSPDTEVHRIPVTKDKARDKVIDANGNFSYIGHSLRLLNSKTEFYPDGSPKDYTAVISIDDSSDVCLKVNEPYGLSWSEDLYLSSINDGFCILEIVKQPWKHVQYVGIWMLIAGSVLLFVQGTGKSKKTGK